MKNVYVSVYVLILLFVLTGCESTSLAYYVPEEIAIKVDFDPSVKEYTPADKEKAVNNVSVFLVNPSSHTILYKFVNVGYVEEEMVVLSLEPKIVRTKDVYIVANYSDVNRLNDIDTLTDLELLLTSVFEDPDAEQTDYFIFGSLLGFDFEHELDIPVVNLKLVSSATYTNYFSN